MISSNQAKLVAEVVAASVAVAAVARVLVASEEAASGDSGVAPVAAVFKGVEIAEASRDHTPG